MKRANEHTVVGTVTVLEEVWSPQLENARDILVYLPPSYPFTEQRYPVIYMHDAQNLFDEAMSYSGEWQVDETLEELSRQGVEAIVVGIPNMGEQRLDECCPFPTDEAQSRGEPYLGFIVETLKPLVDQRFRTLPDRDHTGMAGSSMGALITLYAFFRYPKIFGFAAAMSPSCWFASRGIFPYVQQVSLTAGRKLYLDVGTGEGEEEVEDTRRMRDLLLQKGLQIGQDFLYVEEEGAEHNEASWAYRLHIALRFLLPRIELNYAVQA